MSDDLDLPAPVVSEGEAREREAQAIKGLANAYSRMQEEIGKVIIGQHNIIDDLLVAMFCRGHCLLVGVPGLANHRFCAPLLRQNSAKACATSA